MPSTSFTLAQSYTHWLDAHRRRVLGVAAVLFIVAASVASRLPVHADFSYLLPEQSESVQHLRALEKRARVLGTAMVAVRGTDAQTRARAAELLHTKIGALDAGLVSNITYDKRVPRAYAWEHRWLLPTVAQLTALRDGLPGYLQSLRARANPMVLSLDDDDAPTPAHSAVSTAAVTELTQKLAQLDKDRADPGEFVSPDQRLQMMIVQTPFPAGDVHKDAQLLAALNQISTEVRQQIPGLDIGIAGDVVTSFEEHRAILNGMVTATLITLALCLGALWAFYRSFTGVLSLAASLCLGTVLTFMVTRLTIGHLNVATAFLASIVLGNGINFGIMLLARYLEALREGHRGPLAVTWAIHDTVHGTLAAAVTAAVAYLSLTITAFRGFCHFGIIAGVGMLLCWASSYTLLPTLLLAVGRTTPNKPRREPAVGPLLARMMPREPRYLLAVCALLAAASGVVTYRYLANDPYESNFKNLRSVSDALVHERAWMTAVDEAFGRGISGGFVIGVKRRDEARPLLERLRALDADKPAEERLFSRLNSLDDYLPDHQAEKMARLAEIRAALSDEVIASLPAAARKKILALRPPQKLTPLGDADVPEAMAWPFIEADGSRGRLILANSGYGYEVWNSHDIVRFADTVRGLKLGPDVLLGGSAFVFSDMLRFIERDGPRATLAAMVAATLAVCLILGLRLEAVVTLVSGLLGTLVMLAVVALTGIKINFLDFVALPITIGIGIDYAVNICARARVTPRGPGWARSALTTAGGAVCMSSYTTIVGYGSLLSSSNLGIRSFGHAAILGEATCLSAALLLAPALLDLFGRRPTVAAQPKPTEESL